VVAMPEKRPGQELIRLYLPEGLKSRFKRYCSIKGSTMTEEITRFVERTVETNEDLIQLVEQKLSDRSPQ
jgi:hypothetical protein